MNLFLPTDINASRNNINFGQSRFVKCIFLRWHRENYNFSNVGYPHAYIINKYMISVIFPAF